MKKDSNVDHIDRLKVEEFLGEETMRMHEVLSEVREAIWSYAAAFPKNATYNKSDIKAEEYMNLDVVKAFIHALTGQRYYLIGPAGIGKTSFVQALVNALNKKMLKINATYINVDMLSLPVLGWEKLSETEKVRVVESVLWSKFSDDRPKVIFIDELSRAEAGVANALMELLQEGSIGGKKIPNLVTVIAADNPQGAHYGRMSGLDFAQADRFTTVELDSTSTPWRRAIAQEFAETDLTKVYSTYDTLDSEIREVLNPRVLAFTIRALLEGFPGEYALPMVNGVRRMLVNRGGEEVTKNVLDRIAAALNVTNPEYVSDKIEKTLEFAVKHRQNVYIQGRPGIAKTATIKSWFAKRKIHTGYNSATSMEPEILALPVVTRDAEYGDSKLELAIAKEFVRTEPWVWIVDEICRGSRRVQNALMEPIQERTIGGAPTSLMCTIALNNPPSVAGYKLNVGQNDLAQASRFALSIEIEAADLPWAKYLKSRYEEDVATQVIEWWEEDLDEVGRVLCTPRCLERIIGQHIVDNPLEWALPVLGGKRVKVPMHDLRTRLEGKQLTRLKALVADVDYYEALLSLGIDQSRDAQTAIHYAFSKADVESLSRREPVDVHAACVTLYRVLAQQSRISLMRNVDAQKFWTGILNESVKEHKLQVLFRLMSAKKPLHDKETFQEAIKLAMSESLRKVVLPNSSPAVHPFSLLSDDEKEKVVKKAIDAVKGIIDDTTTATEAKAKQIEEMISKTMLSFKPKAAK